jgi:hypothetical protein
MVVSRKGITAVSESMTGGWINKENSRYRLMSKDLRLLSNAASGKKINGM